MTYTKEATLGSQIELEVERLVHGGQGLARAGDLVCFVSGAVPGDRVKAKVIEVKKSFLRTEPIAYLSKSPLRTEPACPLFGECGGCQWQHIGYRHQLHWKTEIVRDCLERIGGFKNPDVLPAIPSPPLNYRSRASFKVNSRRFPAIGYFKEKTHAIIPVTNCPILDSPLNAVLAQCREMIFSNSPHFSKIDSLGLLLVYRSGKVLATLRGNRGSRSRTLAFGHDGELLEGLDDDAFQEDVSGLSFLRSGDSFYQVNFSQNIILIKTVLHFLNPLPGDNVLDLYCGSGNFSLFLARCGARVTGVDSSKASIREAAENAESNHIESCRFKKARDVSFHYLISQDNFKSVLLNPPRTGCPKQTLMAVTDHRPQDIIYVSCDPATLARDLRLVAENGYHLQSIQPIDVFPQTYHIETVVKLARK